MLPGVALFVSVQLESLVGPCTSHNKAQKLTRLYAVGAIKKVGGFGLGSRENETPPAQKKGGVSTASHVLAIGRPFDSDRVIVCVIF